MNFVKNQNGFSALEVILLIIVTALVAGGGVYLWQRSADVATKQTETISKGTAAIKKADQQLALNNVKAFYQELLGGEAAPISVWVNGGFITQNAADKAESAVGFDPFTCSQNPLPFTAYTFANPEITGSTGTLKIDGKYDQDTVKIELNLKKVGSKWLIDEFKCP